MRGSMPLGRHILQISILSSSCWHMATSIYWDSCELWPVKIITAMMNNQNSVSTMILRHWWRYLLSTSTYSSRFFAAIFYFLRSKKLNYFYFIESRILGIYFYFLESDKVTYFWQHCICLHVTATMSKLEEHSQRCLSAAILYSLKQMNHFSSSRSILAQKV